MMAKDKYTSKKEAIVFLILQILWNAREKFLQTAYCLLRSMFSFECSRLRLHEQINISLLLQQP